MNPLLPPGTIVPTGDGRLVSPNPQRRRGACKFFNSQKGFGFVIDSRPEELDNQEVFVHWTSIMGKTGFKSLAEGEEVEYEIQQTAKGFSAINMTGPGGRPVIGDPRARSTSPPQYMYPFTLRDLNGAGSPIIDPYSANPLLTSPYTQHTVMLSPVLGMPHNPSATAALLQQQSPSLASMAAAAAAQRGGVPNSMSQGGNGLQLFNSPLSPQHQQFAANGGFGGLGIGGGATGSPFSSTATTMPMNYSSPALTSSGQMTGGRLGASMSGGAGSLRNSPAIGGFGGMGGGAFSGGLGIPDLDSRFSFGRNSNGDVSRTGSAGRSPENGDPSNSRDLLYQTSYYQD